MYSVSCGYAIFGCIEVIEGKILRKIDIKDNKKDNSHKKYNFIFRSAFVFCCKAIYAVEFC